MTEGTRERQPLLGDVPAVVFVLVGTIALASSLMLAGPPRLSNLIFFTCALWVGGDPPAGVDQQLGRYAPYALHVLVHGSWAHLGLNAAGLAAFGAATARQLRSPLLFLGFFILCSIAGAIAEAALPRTAATPMLGASSGVFGLIAAATYIRAGRGGPPPSPFSPAMLAGLAPWVAINAVMAFAGGLALAGSSIAWAAHFGGLAAGVALFPLFYRLARP